GEGRLRSRIRRASAEARAAEADHRSAGDEAAGRDVQARRHRVRQRERGWESGVVAGAGTGGGELRRGTESTILPVLKFVVVIMPHTLTPADSIVMSAGFPASCGNSRCRSLFAR